MGFKEKYAASLRRRANRIEGKPPESEEVKVNTLAQKSSTEEAVLIRSMLSHNVRMPLSIISGYGNLLKQDVIKDEEKKKECIEKICGNITYLSNVLSLIIDGNERTGLTYNFEDMDLVKCVRETAGYVAETSKRYGLRVQVNSPRKEVFINGDYTQMMRVIFNLFENSVKYMGREGSIVMTVDEPDPEEVLLIYKDDGKGMKAEEAKHIFDKGYRGTNSSYGTGMGMFYVKEVIEAHNGTIDVITDTDKGMCIKMTLKQNKGT